MGVKQNKTGLQPVSRPVEWIHYLEGGVAVQSPFDAIATDSYIAGKVSPIDIE